MLTPAFELSQDAAFLTVIIKARYAKVTETEVFIDGADFKFYSKPYFLRLNLPGRLLEDGREKASYDVESGTFTIRVPKETPGEEFQGLDLLTRLLAPQGQASAKEPSIEVLGDHDAVEKKREGGEEERGEGEGEDFDWQVSQQPYSGDEERSSRVDGAPRYGFANRRSGVFKRLRDELCGVVDIHQADEVSLPERKRVRVTAENDKFDDSHYLADLYQDDTISPILQFKPPWVLSYRRMRERMVAAGDRASPQHTAPDVVFSDEEKELMLKLPRKEFILSGAERRGALLGVVDILFAYAYNVRTLEGERSVESAWTICKLSSTLSCLDCFGTPRELVVACCRRALCYPLYRNWDLCRKVLKDVRMMLRLGRNQVLKSFFEIHKLLSNDEPRYILNDLYISDYCVWLQTIDDQTLADLEQEVGKVQIEKKDVGLDLDDLEEAASQVKTEEEVLSQMETAKQPDPAGNNHHGNVSHQPVREGDPQSSAVHQVGYPDLIQRSAPAPDIVTTHVVRSSGNGDVGQGHEQGRVRQDHHHDDEDDDDEDDDDDDVAEEDDSSSEEEENRLEGIKEANCATIEGKKSCERTRHERMEHSLDVSACSGQTSLERDFVSKVSIATMDVDSATASQPVLSAPAAESCQSHQDRTEHKPIRESQTCKVSSSGDFHDVTETMQQMLDQLSLQTRAASISDKSGSSDHGMETLMGDQKTEWYRSPPQKPIEMLDGN